MPDPSSSRRRFLQTALGTAAVLGLPRVLTACGDDDEAGGDAPSSSSSAGDGTAPTSEATTPTSAAALERISILEPFPLFLIFFAEVSALSAGFAEENGLDVDLQFARSAPQALQQLAAGSVVACVNGPLAVVRAVSQEGAPFRMFGMTVQESLYRLVSTEDAPFDDVRQLPGRTVGFPTLAGNAEDTFNIMLSEAGIAPEEVERVQVGNEAAALALVDEGRVDCIFATLEAATTMRTVGLRPHVVKFADANPLLGSGLVTTEENLTRHRTALVGWIRAVRESMLAIRDPQRLPELMEQVRQDDRWDLPQLDDVETSRAIISAFPEMWFAAGEENLLRNVPERWEAGVASFERIGLAAPGSDPTSFYTNDLWEEATS